MNARVIISAVLFGLITLGAWWIYDTFESVPAKRMTGYTGEARSNPFLAAERFFGRMGVRPAKVRSLPELDALPARGLLIAGNGRQGFDAARIDRLVRWIEAGGHLVVEAELQGVPDPLLEALGMAREAGKAAPEPVGVQVGERRLAVAFFDGMTLTPGSADTPLLRGADKIYTYRMGRGAATIATSLHFARNANIGKHDHAEFLWALATLSGAGEARFLYQPRRLSLWGFLTDNALPVLAAAGLLLAAWLWRIAPRFGPVAPDLPPARRRLLDHLRASGRYYWAKGLRSRLVVAARDAALRRIARAQPDFATASQAEKISRLSSLVKISEEEAARFLGAAGAMRGADFIRVAQHAQRIHSALEKGDK